jgi:3-phenylpropionate/trans-cinnamate dioxygenase ferredoxin component
MSGWFDVAPADAIGPGHCVVVELGGIAVAVCNAGGTFYAIEDACSHEVNPLSDGQVEGETIVCAAHGARFSLRTGEALSAPAYEPIAIFAVRVENGMVQVRSNDSALLVS